MLQPIHLKKDGRRFACNKIKYFKYFKVAESYCIDRKANLTIRNVNKHLSALQSECIENDNISSQHLRRKGLHLNAKGKSRLALNFMKQTEKV